MAVMINETEWQKLKAQRVALEAELAEAHQRIAELESGTRIAEQDLIDAIHPMYEFYKETHDKAKEETVLGVGFGLADKLMERNDWSREQRKAFVHRLFKYEQG